MASPAATVVWRLYTRQGCCLCEGLRERLEALDPPPLLELLDVDADPVLQARYGLLVPVLAVPVEALQAEVGTEAWRDLPPVPPRLSGERLVRWLEGQGAAARG